jgi:hypothetical protein
MKLFEIEIGRSYKCELREGEYFGTVKEKRDGQIGVVLGEKIGSDADPAARWGTQALVWLAPEHVHPL